MTDTVLRFLNSLPPSPFVRFCLLVLVCTLLQLYVSRALALPGAAVWAAARAIRLHVSVCACLLRPLRSRFTRFVSPVFRLALRTRFALYVRVLSPFWQHPLYARLPLSGCTLVSLLESVCSLLCICSQRCVASWRYTFGAPVVALYWFAAFVRLHVRCPRSALCSCVTRFARSLVCSALVPRARCARYCIRSSACLHSVRVSSAQLSHSELSLLRSRLCVACGACGEPAHCCRGVTGPVCSTGDCVSRVAHVASPRAVVAVSLGRCSSRAFASPSAALLPFQLWLKEHLARVQFPLA